jgi:tight adherence protein B
VLSAASYRSRINRRLMLSKDRPDRESVLVELRRERGLTGGGNYRLGLVALNRLILQSGLTIGFARLASSSPSSGRRAFGADLVFRGSLLEAVLAALFSATALPILVLRLLRGAAAEEIRRQFPDALDIIVRSLRAGHPVPIAITMVGAKCPIRSAASSASCPTRSPTAPIWKRRCAISIAASAPTTLPLFVTAVAIQGSTGGNLGEILENLSGVIRQRFKMRRKIRALAAEGRASAMILSALPIGMFIVIQIIAPDFYASVWHEHLTKVLLVSAGAGWMCSAISSCSKWSTSRSEPMDQTPKVNLCPVRQQRTTMLSVLVFLATGTLAFAVMIGVRAREAVRRRAARVGIDDEDSRRPAFAALFRLQGRAEADRLHDQALFGRRQRKNVKCCAAA